MSHPYVPAGQPGEDAQNELYVGTTIDELEARAGSPDPTQPQAPDLSQKLDGDSIPEEFRGMTVDQLLQRAKGHVEVIKRMTVPKPDAPTPTPQPAAQPSAPEPLPQITAEQFREIYERDPVEALAVYGQVTEARMMRMFEDRLKPLVGNIGSSAEFQARQQFPDEFKLFENEIRQAAAQVPNRQALATPEGWAAIVKYVRGENDEKWFEYKMSKRSSSGSEPAVDPQRTAADATLRDMAPALEPSPTNGRGRAAKGYTGPLTEEMKDNIRVLGVSEADYRANYI